MDSRASAERGKPEIVQKISGQKKKQDVRNCPVTCILCLFVCLLVTSVTFQSRVTYVRSTKGQVARPPERVALYCVA
jgi:hypothetical protein